MANWFLEEYLIFFKFWLMQRCKLSMLRILVDEWYLSPPPIQTMVCINTMALILSSLGPMGSVFNNHVKAKSLLSIWQNQTYHQFFNFLTFLQNEAIFAYMTSEAPKSLVVNIFSKDLILKYFGESILLNFFLYLISQIFVIFHLHQHFLWPKSEEKNGKLKNFNFN